MTADLLIGNGLSLVAAVFTVRSSLSRERRYIYLYQVIQCLLLAVASVFFRSWAGIVSLLVCALRNYLASEDRLNRGWTLVCLFLVLVPGVLLNNRGWVGAIVIGANAIYTAGMYLARSEMAIKCNMLVNLLLWMVYEVLIVDLPSLAADTAALISVCASLRKHREIAGARR